MAGRFEVVTSGWFYGCNSVKNPWLLRADQYRWGVNVVNRGGIVQTRPGYTMRLTLPPGNLQGGIFFSANRQVDSRGVNDPYVIAEYMVFAVDGKVYAAPFPLNQPRDWEKFRLQNVNFNSDAAQIFFCVGERNATVTQAGNIALVPSYRILMMQDGTTIPAYFDGLTSEHLPSTEQIPKTPIGTWMAFSGNRLWVANGALVLASDLSDPLSFSERLSGEGRGDFKFDGPVTGLASFTGAINETRLVVFTELSTSTLFSGIRDRATWPLTPNFQAVLFASVGCVSGRSIVFQAGIMWWYSSGGLVATDTATTAYLSSQVVYKDVEMARTKRLIPGGISNVCGASHESYLLMSVPYAEHLNSHTMVLDYASASESGQAQIPSWTGVWTGTRPVEWSSALAEGRRRLFHFSVDYNALGDGSHNHLWECFSPERVDSYFRVNPDYTTTTFRVPIYSSMETALLGSGLDLKEFQYAEIDLTQIGGDVQLRASYRGTRGPYKPILEKKILAIVSPYQFQGTAEQREIENLGLLRTQARRVMTQNATRTIDVECESGLSESIDKCFSILVEWCGAAGVEGLRIYMDPFTEKSTGECSKDETLACIVAEDGQNSSISPLALPSLDSNASQLLPSWVRERSYTASSICPDESFVGSVSATATVAYRSYVSADDAATQALAIAQQRANQRVDLFRVSNPCAWRSTRYATAICVPELNAVVTCGGQQSTGRIIVGGAFTLDHATTQGRISARLASGARDLSFTQEGGFDDTVNALLVDSSDRVVVGGAFTVYGSTASSKIARLLSSGFVDPAFVVGTGFTGGDVLVLAQQPDGKILVGGTFDAYKGVSCPALVRLESNGTLDATFTPTGVVSCTAIALQADDFVVAAINDNAGIDPCSVTRFETDATVDGTFTPFAFNAYATTSLSLDATERILFCHGVLERLETDGTLDAAFLPVFDADAITTLPQADGTIFVAGDFTTANGNTRLRIALLEDDGTSNVWILVQGMDDIIMQLKTLLDGNILAVGNFTFAGDTFSTRVAIIDIAEEQALPLYESLVRSAVVTSTVSQADADTAAQTLADNAAATALPCV